jgi:nucleoside-diphosphate-sugar epimerase
VKILIAGGAGFLGSHLSEKFLEEGWEVTVLDNYLTGSRDNLVALLDHSHFSLSEYDITQPFGQKGGFQKRFDWILHFASPTSPKDYQRYPLETLRAGSLGTLNLLELAQEHKSRFFYASSSEVYGDPLVSFYSNCSDLQYLWSSHEDG